MSEDNMYPFVTYQVSMCYRLITTLVWFGFIGKLGLMYYVFRHCKKRGYFREWLFSHNAKSTQKSYNSIGPSSKAKLRLRKKEKEWRVSRFKIFSEPQVKTASKSYDMRHVTSHSGPPPHTSKWVSENQTPESASVHDSNYTCNSDWAALASVCLSGGCEVRMEYS